MSCNVIVRYTDGVLIPEEPVQLAENSRFLLVPLPDAEEATPPRPPIGSREAQLAFIEHCKASKLKLGGWNGREELYDDRI
ncbi:MAG: hypothetical protein KF777_05350 [Planctomycetaceae bacterium]|nr:hypothetical protein [Planctomycetaceae bacterium]